jgi:hypothetical protein
VARSRRMARCTRPSSLKASSPVRVLRLSGVCGGGGRKGCWRRGRAARAAPQTTPRPPPSPSLALGKRTTELTPAARARSTSRRRPDFQPRRDTPGIDGMGTSLSPSWMNTGSSRLAGVRYVSVTALRMVGERRLRRGREGRSWRKGSGLVAGGGSGAVAPALRAPTSAPVPAPAAPEAAPRACRAAHRPEGGQGGRGRRRAAARRGRAPPARPAAPHGGWRPRAWRPGANGAQCAPLLPAAARRPRAPRRRPRAPRARAAARARRG